MTDELRTRFRGALLRPGEEGYDEARRVWNGAIDRRPALIARCAGADDVVAAVRFARDHDLLVSVKGGGHAVAGHAVCDGGLMIDLSLMKAIRVDPTPHRPRGRRRALARARPRHPGVRPRHHRRRHQPHRHRRPHPRRRPRAPDAQLGLTVDNLLGVDLVTAEGEQIRADGETEPELFWGLRGGGGNFGIATAFEYRLHPVGPMVLGGPVFWPIDDGDLRCCAACASTSRGAGRARDHDRDDARAAAPVHARRTGRQAGRRARARVGRRPGRGSSARSRRCAQIGTPIVDAVAVVAVRCAPVDARRRRAARAPLLLEVAPAPELSDAGHRRLPRADGAMTSPFAQITAGRWAARSAASTPGATAVGEREDGFDVSFATGWLPDDPEPERHRAWSRTAWDALAPYSAGIYANFISDEGDGRHRGRVRRPARAADRAQGPLGPRQRLPDERQHPAQREGADDRPRHRRHRQRRLGLVVNCAAAAHPSARSCARREARRCSATRRAGGRRPRRSRVDPRGARGRRPRLPRLRRRPAQGGAGDRCHRRRSDAAWTCSSRRQRSAPRWDRRCPFGLARTQRGPPPAIGHPVRRPGVRVLHDQSAGRRAAPGVSCAPEPAASR